MAIKRGRGRPPKFNLKIVNKLADSIAHNYNVVDSCRYAGISTSTYYFYLKKEGLFREKIAQAVENQNKVNFNFRTM